jgi:aminopeptidase-like protein
MSQNKSAINSSSIITEPSSIEKYFDRLWPICRSITGNGLRESFGILQELIPLALTEVPTGTKVFDWEIPKEWNVTEAYIITPAGEKICSFSENNLHLINYAEPVEMEIDFDTLDQHLFSLPDLPDAIPYVTSYYKRTWGFCITHNQRAKLSREGKYKVVIKSNLKDGSLTYGDVVLKGKSEKEILFSTYLCHPSMANNELSGPLVTAFIYRELLKIPDRKYSYRFVFAPETIGIIAYLAKNGDHLLRNIHAGYVMTCCGDTGKIHFKRSKQGNSIADIAAEHMLKYSGEPYAVEDFSVGGSDERQYCSPGFNLPVGSFMRTPYKQYPEYHTSLDNKNLISFSAMMEMIDACVSVVKILELNENYTNQNPFCEPRLGKRGLYSNVGAQPADNEASVMRLLHLLAFADGQTDLITIAEKKNSSALAFQNEISLLKENGLLK